MPSSKASCNASGRTLKRPAYVVCDCVATVRVVTLLLQQKTCTVARFKCLDKHPQVATTTVKIHMLGGAAVCGREVDTSFSTGLYSNTRTSCSINSSSSFCVNAFCRSAASRSSSVEFQQPPARRQCSTLCRGTVFVRRSVKLYPKN